MPALSTLATLALLSAGARATLYPNHPIADTVFAAGAPSTVTWIDDGSKPHLADLPKLQLDLYGPDDKMLQTLDKAVDPAAKQTTVVFGSAGSSGAGYYLRFHAPKPPVDIYTARFAIGAGPLAANNAAVAAANASASNPNPSSGMKVAPASGGATIAPVVPAGGPTPPTPASTNTTLTLNTPAPAPPPPVNAAATPTHASTTSVGATAAATLIPHGPIGAAASGARDAFAFARGLDLEALKFRLVFILWPALMGITLAL